MSLKNILVGIRVPPIIVAAARAIILAGATAIIGAAITQAGAIDWGDYAYLAPFVIAGLRGLEGAFDQKVTPNQNDTPPTTVVSGEKAGGTT